MHPKGAVHVGEPQEETLPDAAQPAAAQDRGPGARPTPWDTGKKEGEIS